MQARPLDLLTRLWFAWVCYFRVLFDGAFAGRVFAVREHTPEPAPPAAVPAPAKLPEAPGDPRESQLEGALILLALLQREGRLVHFLRQDVASFEDAAVGAAARVVHAGCRKALDGHVELAHVRDEDEGAVVAVSSADSLARVKLTGNVRGEAPFSGTLRHRGWCATKVTLPTPTKGHDVAIVCPAEVEL